MPDTEAPRPYLPGTLAPLLAAAAAAAGRTPEELAALGEVLLHRPPSHADGLEGRSDLNWNGSPLQLLLSTRPGGAAARLIADPAFFVADPLERFERSLQSLRETLAACGAAALRAPAWCSLSTVLPREREHLARYPTGMIRLAAALEGPGAAVYVGSVPDRDEAWERVRAWAGQVLPAGCTIHRAVKALREVAYPFGVGLEGTGPARARAKLYWRLVQPASLAETGVAGLRDGRIADFLAALLEGRAVPLHALTFSAAWELARGDAADVKVDVCARTACLPGGAALLETADRRAAALGVDVPPLRRAVQASGGAVEVGCLGAGVDQRGGPRLNAYLFQP